MATPNPLAIQKNGSCCERSTTLINISNISDVCCVFTTSFFSSTTTVSTRLVAFPVTVCSCIHHLYGAGSLVIIYHYTTIWHVILGWWCVQSQEFTYVEGFSFVHLLIIINYSPPGNLSLKLSMYSTMICCTC